jgi:hypothetical protein
MSSVEDSGSLSRILILSIRRHAGGHLKVSSPAQGLHFFKGTVLRAVLRIRAGCLYRILIYTRCNNSNKKKGGDLLLDLATNITKFGIILVLNR